MHLLTQMAVIRFSFPLAMVVAGFLKQRIVLCEREKDPLCIDIIEFRFTMRMDSIDSKGKEKVILSYSIFI